MATATLPSDYSKTEKAAIESYEQHQINKNKFGYKPSQFIRNAIDSHLATKESQTALQALAVVAPAFKAASEFTIPGLKDISTAMEIAGEIEEQAVEKLSDATNVDPVVLRGIEAAATLPFVSKHVGKLAAKAPGVSQLRGAKNLLIGGLPQAGAGDTGGSILQLGSKVSPETPRSLWPTFFKSSYDLSTPERVAAMIRESAKLKLINNWLPKLQIKDTTRIKDKLDDILATPQGAISYYGKKLHLMPPEMQEQFRQAGEFFEDLQWHHWSPKMPDAERWRRMAELVNLGKAGRDDLRILEGTMSELMPSGGVLGGIAPIGQRYHSGFHRKLRRLRIEGTGKPRQQMRDKLAGIDTPGGIIEDALEQIEILTPLNRQLKENLNWFANTEIY